VGIEGLLAEVLAGVLDRDEVPTDAHVFDDLGADSMVMAKFCARVRKHPDLPSIAIKDVYTHPTVAALATALTPDPAPPSTDLVPATGTTPRAGRPAAAVCGVVQLLFVLGYALLVAAGVTWTFERISAAPTLPALYLDALVIGAAASAVLVILPILLKWLLVGRWRPTEFRVWGPAYVRFWIVKILVRTNPLVLFAGSPIYSVYLRLLGARIGRGVAVFGQVPVCTDLFSAGDGTVVRKDSLHSCYRAHDGRIQTGRVTLGKDVVVGETTVLDIDTSMGDGATLGHTSSLHRGQSVPAGETWHGSPARPTDVGYRSVAPVPCGRLRRVVYSTAVLLLTLTVVVPLGAGGGAFVFREVPQLAALLEPGVGAFTTPAFYVETVAVSAVLYFGVMLVGLLLVLTLPRLLGLLVRPDRVYPLYGVHYWLHQAVVALTNVMTFTYLFGDSSAIAHYLGRLGYGLRPLVQTGSNFGMAVKHESPYLTSVGSGTVIADGLSVMNADYSSTSFRVSPTAIGAHNFLGNRVAYPSQGRTGDDCLLATKVMVPIDGPVRQGVGLLGSPSFEIPRTVARDCDLGTHGPEELRRLLAQKNRHNALSMVVHLLVRWFYVLELTVLVAAVGTLPVHWGAVEMLIAEVLVLLFSVVWFTLVDRSVRRLAVRVPAGCSIYDRSFWRHERFWKIAMPDWMQLFNGTPWKNLVWRLLGVRIGARVFDDGAGITERTFATIGDDTTLNEGVVLQCHSQEDGAFKSDHVRIGARCTLGVSAFVHYGTTVGDDAVLAPDTFLMKGEEVPPGERWGGNPAREMAETTKGHR
jgi:non-ribosomal peptide synthetase-like protein